MPMPGVLPMPIVIAGRVHRALALWLDARASARRSTPSAAMPKAARAAGDLACRGSSSCVYVLAGGCYGLAGVFVSAQTGAGDPLVGNSHAAAGVHGDRRRRHRVGRRPRRPARLDHRRLYPDDGRQHSARPQCLRLLLDDRRRRDPDPCRAQRLARPRCAARRPYPRRSSRRLGAWRAGHAAAQRGAREPPASPSSAKPRRRRPRGQASWVRHRRGAALCAAGLSLLLRRHPGDAISCSAARCCSWQYYQFADRAVVVPGHPRAGPGGGDPDRRARSVAALDDRALRHPARRHGQGVRCRARLCAAARAARGLRHRPRQRRWAWSSWDCRRSS